MRGRRLARRTKMAHRRRTAPPLVLLVLLLAAAPASARTGLQLEQFEPQADGGLLNLSTARLVAPGAWQLALWSSWAEAPLRLLPADAADMRVAADVVPAALRFEIVAAYGPWQGLDLTLTAPLATGVGAGAFTVDGRTPAELSDTGPGDMRLLVGVEPVELFTGRSLAERTGGFGLALSLATWLPTGSTNRLEGEGGVRFEPRLAVDFSRGPWRLAGNIGIHLRSETTLHTYVNDDVLRWGVGGEAPLGLPGLTASAVVYGSRVTVEQPDPLDPDTSLGTDVYDPLEALLAVHYRWGRAWVATLGGGRGLRGGLGEPTWRGIARFGFQFAPSGSSAAARPGDADGDGIEDDRDRCPFEPERVDGVRDADGCPEADLSVVRRAARIAPGQPLPTVPAVPLIAAPLPDGDGDGVPDEIDGCPTEAEDRDGTADGDGCPEADDDGDGVADAVDRCPRVAETVNGLDDDDGCPDSGTDTDGDGIEDHVDVCPTEPETKNDVRDWDGCPEGLGGTGRVPLGLQVAGAGSDAPAPAEDGIALVELGPLPPLPPLPRDRDGDGDGINDDADGCPDIAEDLDGFADGDGCPDPDNDGDGVPDDADRCPTAGETVNGFEDGDGCPDVGIDTDGDGIGDTEDDCPRIPETKNDVRDWDGCPERVRPVDAVASPGDEFGLAIDSPTRILPPLLPVGDPDGDGMSGADDACPMAAEDMDGFEDGDGCPEADNDDDGIEDARDRCPTTAETLNFFNDTDGCPDRAPGQMAGLIGIVESIQFKVGKSDLEPWTLPTLKRVAAVMKRYPSLRLRIDGHTDSTGEPERNFELSYDRANAVRDWLMARGIASHRMTAYGYGEDRPIASNLDLKGRFINRRVELSYTESSTGDPP